MATILLIDDVRTLKTATETARTCADGMAMLERYRHRPIDELWLDYSLGGWHKTIEGVLSQLIKASNEGRAFAIKTIFVHTASPSKGQLMVDILKRAGYSVKRTHFLADVTV